MSEDLLPSPNASADASEVPHGRPMSSAVSAAAPDSAFPGWYPDPAGMAAERFWNGRRWTTQTKGPRPESPAGPVVEVDLAEVVTGKDRPGDEIRIVADRGDDIQILPTPSDRPERPDNEPKPDRSFELGGASDAIDVGQRSLFAPAAGSELRRVTVSLPTPDVQPKQPEQRMTRRHAWLAVAAAAVVGCGLGYGVGSASRQQETVEAQITLNESVRSAQLANETTPVGDALELQRRLDSLNSELSTANDELTLLRDEVETASTEAAEARLARDRLAEHNTLLQSWFTEDLRSQGQTAWDAEVDRACGLPSGNAALTIDQLQFTQTMELIGTKADLLAEVQACATSG